MKLIRSIGTLVLLGSVSWMLGCTADENTAGPNGSAAGSGVAGGAVVPQTHAHEGEDVHAHEGDAPKEEEPKTEETKTEEPKTEETKTEEPKTEETTTEEPKTEAPVSETPATEAPATDAPKSE